MSKRAAMKIGWTGEVARLREIATILFEEGFHRLVDRLHLGSCVSLRCRLRCMFLRGLCHVHLKRELPFEVRFVSALERLGPTFVKIGQVLSMRSDFLSDELCQALSRLHSHVPAFSSDTAMRIISDELGTHDTYFRSIERDPFAAASLAQVHRAVLRDGRRVVIKVQRPGIERTVLADLDLLILLAKRAEALRPDLQKYRPHANALEFAEYTRKELDFRNEAHIMARFRTNEGSSSVVYIPQPEEHLCTERLLVMEEIPGSQLDVETNVGVHGGKRTALSLARSIVRQIFVHGLFHADPHPGNIIIMKDGRVALIDFGMYGEVDRHMRNQIFRILILITEGRYDEATRSLIGMADVDSTSDLKGYRAEITALYEEWADARMHEMSMARLMFEEMKIGGAYNVRFPRGFVLLLRSIITIESVAQRLYPEAQMAKELAPILREALWESISLWESLKKMGRSLPDLLMLAELAPTLTDQAIAAALYAPDRDTPGGGNAPPPIAPENSRSGPWILTAGLWVAGALLAIGGLPPVFCGLSAVALGVLGSAVLGTVALVLLGRG